MSAYFKELIAHIRNKESRWEYGNQVPRPVLVIITAPL